MKKISYLVAGTIFLILGIVGLFLPVIPQVPFFVVAVVCYGRASTRFQRWFEQTWFYHKIESYLHSKNENKTENKMEYEDESTVDNSRKQDNKRFNDSNSNKIDSQKKLSKKKSWKKRLVILFVIMIVFGIFFWFENHHLVASEYDIVSEKVGADLDGYRIVQISDLHNALFGNANEKLIVKIIEEKPDIIVITGDIVDSNHTRMEVALSFVEAAARICPVYYVTGNHEYWLLKTEQQRLFSGITNAGATLLYNEGIVIEQGADKFVLLGLDDQDLMTDKLGVLMSQVKEDQLSLLLAHEPQYIDHYAEFGVDVVMAGHAHGGQFRLPFIGAVVAPDQGFHPTYTQGLYEEKDTKMIVSRGLGNSVIPVRLFNDPEIVTVTLKSKTK